MAPFDWKHRGNCRTGSASELEETIQAVRGRLQKNHPKTDLIDEDITARESVHEEDAHQVTAVESTASKAEDQELKSSTRAEDLSAKIVDMKKEMSHLRKDVKEIRNLVQETTKAQRHKGELHLSSGRTHTRRELILTRFT